MANEDTVDTIANSTVISILEFVEKRRPEDLLSSSINMIPNGLRNVSPSSYDPRLVSIGPLHKEDQNVQFFEELKANDVHLLLKDLSLPADEILKECVHKVLASMYQIRAFYAGTNVNRYNDIELAHMMVTDACFILQFISVTTARGSALYATLRATATLYDLVLLENQIPFFVLEQVYDSTIPRSSRAIPALPELILKFARLVNVFHSWTFTLKLPSPPYDHILGFLAKCYWPESNVPTAFFLPHSAIHSTVELARVGVIFKPYIHQNWQLDFEFKSSTSACFSWCRPKPTLKLPILVIDNYTELVLRNLIAYEQYYGTKTYVTSYAIAMDMLVNTEEDISKLIESGVMINHLGSNEKAANAVNSLCRELPVLNFCYLEEWKSMDKHYNRYWPKNIADLKRTYFSSPWNLIALLAGIALFALTIVQTIYTVNAA